MSKRIGQISDILERLYARYNRRQFINTDPLQFVYQWVPARRGPYSNRADMEIAALLAAELAYGRVQQIQKSLTDLLGRMGDSPVKFVLNFDEQKRAKLKDFRHRFTTGDDISDLLTLLKKVLNRYGMLQKFFAQGYNPSDENIIGFPPGGVPPALSKFCDSLLDMHAKTHNDCVPRGLSYLLPRPAAGSACKRLNLFLRWMVRNDDVDAGLWRVPARRGPKSIDKAKLIVPMDVHMSRICKILRFYSRKNISLRTAVEVTESFARIEPSDPVKYDFVLCRIGMLGNCNDWGKIKDYATGG